MSGLGVILSLAAMLVVARAEHVVSSLTREERSLDVCLLPKQSGSCFAYFPRFFYDTKTQNCEEFVYGGCGGNANNFNTIEECKARCSHLPILDESQKLDKAGLIPNDMELVCNLPKKTGMCRASFPRFYFDTQTLKCKEFIYGGCDGNANNFGTIEECQSACGNVESVCHLPKQPGLCKAYMPRFYFDTTTQSCEEFIYGGCDGNSNNFKTMEECQTKCGYEPGHIHKADNSWARETDPDYNSECMLPKQSGSCFAYFPRFFYDTKTQSCEEFVYGGCGGNANNFNTIEECNAKCSHLPILDDSQKIDKSGLNTNDMESVCNLPKKTGSRLLRRKTGR